MELARSWVFTVPTTVPSHLHMNKPERCTMTNEIPVTKSTNKGVNTITLDLVLIHICDEDVPLVEFMYLAFKHMPDESYYRRLRSLLLCLC